MKDPNVPSLLLLAGALLAGLAPSTTVSAAEIRLTLANDPVSGNDRKDDLYTSETALEIQLTDRQVNFSERMFTNRIRGIRFDETRAGVTFSPKNLAGWDTITTLGVLHVGKGILGESIQNTVHRAVGSEEVHLPYIENDSYHPTASIVLHRQVGAFGSTPLRADVLVETAPAFRSSAHLRLGLVRELGRGFAVELGAGIRGDLVESEWLEDVVSDVGSTADLTLAWRGVALSFTHNRYGTRSNHVTLGWTASLAR